MLSCCSCPAVSIFTLPSCTLRWPTYSMHHRGRREDGRSEVTVSLLINLQFPEASGSCCSWADLRAARSFDDKALLCRAEVCLRACRGREAKCLWTSCIDVLITAWGNTVSQERGETSANSHVFSLRGGWEKIWSLALVSLSLFLIIQTFHDLTAEILWTVSPLFCRLVQYASCWLAGFILQSDRFGLL